MTVYNNYLKLIYKNWRQQDAQYSLL